MHTRVLKVCGVMPYTTSSGRFVEVPVIRLQGKWLKKLGFTPGKRVRVSRQGEALIIQQLQQEGF